MRRRRLHSRGHEAHRGTQPGRRRLHRGHQGEHGHPAPGDHAHSHLPPVRLERIRRDPHRRVETTLPRRLQEPRGKPPDTHTAPPHPLRPRAPRRAQHPHPPAHQARPNPLQPPPRHPRRQVLGPLPRPQSRRREPQKQARGNRLAPDPPPTTTNDATAHHTKNPEHPEPQKKNSRNTHPRQQPDTIFLATPINTTSKQPTTPTTPPGNASKQPPKTTILRGRSKNIK